MMLEQHNEGFMTHHSKAGKLLNHFTAMKAYVRGLHPHAVQAMLAMAAPRTVQIAMEHAADMEQYIEDAVWWDQIEGTHTCNPQDFSA
jgi:hypothetical protein